MTADGKHDSLDEVEPLLAEGGLGPPAGLDTMRPSTGASVVAPAAIMDRTQPSPACTHTISHNTSTLCALLEQHAVYWSCLLVYVLQSALTCMQTDNLTLKFDIVLPCLSSMLYPATLDPTARNVELYSKFRGRDDPF